jgi:hypothetical protein
MSALDLGHSVREALARSQDSTMTFTQLKLNSQRNNSQREYMECEVVDCEKCEENNTKGKLISYWKARRHKIYEEDKMRIQNKNQTEHKTKIQKLSHSHRDVIAGDYTVPPAAIDGKAQFGNPSHNDCLLHGHLSNSNTRPNSTVDTSQSDFLSVHFDNDNESDDMIDIDISNANIYCLS